MGAGERKMKGPHINELPSISIVVDRNALILAKCADKRVLHIGCVDSGWLEQKYLRETLLHVRLGEVADELWGIDTDIKGLAWLREKGIVNLHYGDAEGLDSALCLNGQQFEVIVASELLEHLDNPGLFLSGVKPYLSGDLIITAPNAFRGDQISRLIAGQELVHPDHVCWYSYTTLNNLLTCHSYQIKYAAMYGLLSACDLSPFFAKGLVFVIRNAQ